MLPQGRWLFLPVIAGAWLGAIAVLGGCQQRGTPEAQVRAVIAAGEQAAEARDLSGLLEHVSPAFLDENGGGRDDLKQVLRGYFVTHQSIALLTRIDSVEFPYRDLARVRVTVGTLGREAAGATAFDLAADVNEIVLELKLEDDEWKVVRAAWQSTRRG
jgi:hypothetical protein